MNALAQAFKGRLDNRLMVKGQFRQFLDRKPLGHPCVITALDMVLVLDDQGKKGNRDHAFTRVAVMTGEGSQLVHVDVLDIGLLAQLAVGTIMGTLVIGPHEAAWQRPHVLVRLQAALDKQHVQLLSIKAEHDRVGRHRRMPEGRFPLLCLLVVLHRQKVFVYFLRYKNNANFLNCQIFV